MRSSSSKIQGKVEAVNSDSHVENGLPPKEKLPTIQIDTVASPPPSPVDLTPPDEANEIEPVDESEVHLDLDTEEQSSETSSDELKEFLKSYVEDLLSQAMVLAEKKLQFAGLPEEEEDEEEDQPAEPVQPAPEPAKEEPEVVDEEEVRATAEKVVQEVIEKASETAAERLESIADLNFPDLPSITIDTVKSAPPSPDLEEEVKYPNKKWSFKMDAEDSDSEKNIRLEETKKEKELIKFEEAPEDVQDAATSFVKEIVGRAVAMAEEKCVPTVPFNFEDVDLMKTSGPWYIRAREALVRLLRTACFCTPRRSDS